MNVNVPLPAKTASKITKRDVFDTNGAVKCVAISTPNATAIMYVMRSKSLGHRTLVFKNPEQAKSASPKFAGEIMKAYPDITRMVLGSNPQGYDYMTITVRNGAAWQNDQMKEKLELALPLIVDLVNQTKLEELIDLSQMPKTRTLNEYFNGYADAGCPEWEARHRAVIAVVNDKLAHDGGEIHFAGYDEPTQTLKVWLDGNCKDCKSSSLTVEFNLLNFFRGNPDKFEKKVQTLQIVQDQPRIVVPVF